MRCPYCSHSDSKVVDSRDSETGEAVRRRRECLLCGKRFTTYERVETIPLYVIKADGRREEFDHGKLLRGLLSASAKRHISREQIETLADAVEAQVRSTSVTEIESRQIGELVMARLRDLDEIVYIRFASVYRDFKDVDDWRQTFAQLLENPPPIRARSRGRRRNSGGTGGDESSLLDLKR